MVNKLHDAWDLETNLLLYSVVELEFELRGGKTCIRYMQFMHII